MDEEFSLSGVTAWGSLGADLGGTADQIEAAQMDPFRQLGGSFGSWAQQVAGYGIVKAIDNRFGPTNIYGDVRGGTFAGQDGRTYRINPSSGLITQSPQYAAASNNNMLLLLLAAGVAVFALAR